MRKLTVKYFKQKEKRIRDAMRFFLRSSPKSPDITKIRQKIILVCKALVKVIAHKELQISRGEYSYMNELDTLCRRLIEKYENETEDGVGDVR